MPVMFCSTLYHRALIYINLHVALKLSFLTSQCTIIPYSNFILKDPKERCINYTQTTHFI